MGLALVHTGGMIRFPVLSRSLPWGLTITECYPEREEGAPYSGEEIINKLTDYLTQSPGTAEAETPDKATHPLTFAERVTSTKPEQLELIPR